VVRTRVGYAGGTTPAPTYHSMGDHTEAMEIDFDPDVLDYEALVDRVWRAHDPTRPAFSTQYRAAFWYANERQRAILEAGAARIAEEREAPIHTAIEPLARFFRAEDYHQKYRLRRERAVVDELVTRYGSDHAMVDSTTAARLNGYLSGNGRRRAFEALLPTLSLSEASARTLLARVP
jgi:peptide-methionine (S)-S-oxide reductase